MPNVYAGNYKGVQLPEISEEAYQNWRKKVMPFVCLKQTVNQIPVYVNRCMCEDCVEVRQTEGAPLFISKNRQLLEIFEDFVAL